MNKAKLDQAIKGQCQCPHCGHPAPCWFPVGTAVQAIKGQCPYCGIFELKKSE